MTLIRKRRLFLFALTVILISACSKPTPPEEETEIRWEDYTILELPFADRPYAAYSTPARLDTTYLCDDQGVILFPWEGKTYYHPVRMTKKALYDIYSYVVTDSIPYVTRAALHARKLIERAIRARDATYFPYCFSLQVHGDDTDRLVAPWFSGMAQGMALSLFVHLYHITQEAEYLEAAGSTYSTFRNLRSKSGPWTVFLDDAGYYWIEEYPIAYPEEAADQVLNGFIFGLTGLYDYYLMNKDPEVLYFIQASLTTLQHYLPAFRNPGDLSAYCLRHRVTSVLYHSIHIDLVRLLYKLTGVTFFQEMADSLYADYHE
ncbi:MAG: hypothetical protein JSW54_02950 [Fidelibacterota bacterium]|nr:MAG: hypothetical protein JSW54_02950 [Candidatus Neomarinimicrobiota bacterium]